MEFTLTQATAQGSRAYQEDRLITERIPSVGFLWAAFDGHRGAETAQRACEALLPTFSTAFQQSPGQADAVLRQTLAELSRITADLRAGSTVSIVFVPEPGEIAWIGTLGDSPVAISDRLGQPWVAPEHNIRSNAEERRMAEARGGLYIGGYLHDPAAPSVGVQLTRCLGDNELSRVLSRDPEIHHILIGRESVGLVGTDGLLNPFEGSPTAQVAKLLEQVRQGANAESLVEDAQRRETGDNVSVVVWRRS